MTETSETGLHIDGTAPIVNGRVAGDRRPALRTHRQPVGRLPHLLFYVDLPTTQGRLEVDIGPSLVIRVLGTPLLSETVTQVVVPEEGH